MRERGRRILGRGQGSLAQWMMMVMPFTPDSLIPLFPHSLLSPQAPLPTHCLLRGARLQL
jgi:hypothetical protein